MGTPTDHGAYASLQAYRLRRRPHPELGVVVTGGSSVRDCMQSEHALARRLSRRMEERVRVHLLASPLQATWETSAFLEHLPDDFRGAVLMTVSPSLLTFDEERMEQSRRSAFVALDSPSLRTAIADAGLRPPLHTGIFLIDHAWFFAFRARSIGWHWLHGSPIGFSPHTYAEGTLAPETEWTRYTEEMTKRLADLERLSSPNLGILAAAIERLRQRHEVRVALLVPPHHPRALEILGAGFRDYRAVLERFAREQRVDLWRLDREARLTAADFYDWVHLTGDSPRRRYQAVLAQRLAALLRELPEVDA
jgi:hypothetical protein